MKNLIFLIVLAGCIVFAAAHMVLGEQRIDQAFSDKIGKIAQIRKAVFEETKKTRNEKLNQLFQAYVRQQGGNVTGQIIEQFHILLKEHDLTNFDDFLVAQTTPVRDVIDPVSKDRVPVFGPLGSDVINPWLAAAGIDEGAPLEKQPMYLLAAKALSEHIDFSLVGIKDPSLSMTLLPPKLRNNGKWAYQRLNPENKFDGGFDHPLFYATIREAVKKLFRQDYPESKYTMAELVAPETQGGFGIQSCLLCHARSHSGVYKRLLGQSLMFEAKAAGLRNDNRMLSNTKTTKLPDDNQDATHAVAEAAMFRLAAQRVFDAFPDKINTQEVRDSLAMLSRDNLPRLKPGYDDFYATLKKIGCMNCHSTDSNGPKAMKFAKHGAFVLNPNSYYKTKNIGSLVSVIDTNNLSKSKLLLKATGKLNHKGRKVLKLDKMETEELYSALKKWIYLFNEKYAGLRK
jgi:hypothetical protein